MNRYVPLTGFVVAVLALSAFLANRLDFQKINFNFEKPKDDSRSYVYKVIDGDTVDVISGGAIYRVRVLWIDAPELGASGECFAQEAKQKALDYLSQKEVVLLPDKEDKDKYSRYLREISTNEGNFGETMIKGGYAKVMCVPPNLSRCDFYKEIEKEAKAKKAGLWGACYKPNP
jgi:micrococcal nuclease